MVRAEGRESMKGEWDTWHCAMLKHNVGNMACGKLQAKSSEYNSPPSVPRKYESQRSKEILEEKPENSGIWTNDLGSPKHPCPEMEKGGEETTV